MEKRVEKEKSNEKGNKNNKSKTDIAKLLKKVVKKEATGKKQEVEIKKKEESQLEKEIEEANALNEFIEPTAARGRNISTLLEPIESRNEHLQAPTENIRTPRETAEGTRANPANPVTDYTPLAYNAPSYIGEERKRNEMKDRDFVVQTIRRSEIEQDLTPRISRAQTREFRFQVNPQLHELRAEESGSRGDYAVNVSRKDEVIGENFSPDSRKERKYKGRTL